MNNKNKLKKVCGNDLCNFLKRNFNPDTVLDLIEKRFNKEGHDIKNIKKEDYNILKEFLNFVQTSSNEVEEEPQKITATQLLKEHGYNLIRVRAHKEANKFKKYFRKNELLCKFDSESVYRNTNVYFIVKDHADKIKPSSNPKRQDEYSVSVMSMKVSKDGRNVLQITSRYNHTVKGCDNTHNSDLDSIVQGLSNAFNHEFKYKIKRKSSKFEFDNFVEIDGVFVHYNKEIEGIKIGNNTLITDRIINFSFDQFYTYDYFIINLKTKKIEWDKYFNSEEGFVTYFNNVVERIIFVKDIDLVDDNNCDKVCYIQK